MKKPHRNPDIGKQPDIPDIKKIEKDIRKENKNKITEVPDNHANEMPGKPPEEMPERKEENEIEDPDQ